MTRKNGRFRFPVAGITFMILSFGLVVMAIRDAQHLANTLTTFVHEGRTYAYLPAQVSLLGTFGFAFGLTFTLAVVVWAILFLRRRDGAHRLAEAQTWPQR